jgi:PiT family inorganic phosphate transporter
MNVVILLIILFLAYSNGANDNFKGVATLYSSNVTNYKKALIFGTVFTFLGSLAAIFIASVLVDKFAGKGLLPIAELDSMNYVFAIASGAAITIFLATKLGMPVSTTHALLGGILGVGIISLGTSFDFLKLSNLFLLPLILSPLVAALLSIFLYSFFTFLRKKMKISKETCICVGKEFIPVAALKTESSCDCNLEYTASVNTVKIASNNECIEVYRGRFIGFDINQVISITHFLSAGWLSFARGLNDTPKIVGLIIGLELLQVELSMTLVALTMACGALLSARKVALTMAKKITKMNQGQGMTANIITSSLVTLASVFGMPVSTTHVSVGAIYGMGMTTKENNTKMLKKILLSWVLTLPLAAIVAGVFYLFFS